MNTHKIPTIERIRKPRDADTGLTQIEAEMKRDKKTILFVERTEKSWIIVCKS